MPDNFTNPQMPGINPPSSPLPPIPPAPAALPITPIPPETKLKVPPAKNAKNIKILLAILSLFFILVSVPAAVFLAKQRQEVRKRAEEQTLTCRKWSGGNYSDFPGWFDAENKSNPTIYKINYSGNVSQTIGWRHIYWCDYRKVNLACRDSDSAAFIKPKSSEAIYDASSGGFTPGLGELIVSSHFGGKCQVIQVDVTPCGAGQPFYVIYANDECPTVTPTPTLPTLTPTPTLKVTPTPTVTPSITVTPTPTPTQEPLVCLSLVPTPAINQISKGDRITLSCTARSDAAIPVNHFEFRVTKDSGTPANLNPSSATKTNGNYRGQIQYQISDYGCYKFECRACTSTDALNCTTWGEAR